MEFVFPQIQWMPAKPKKNKYNNFYFSVSLDSLEEDSAMLT